MFKCPACNKPSNIHATTCQHCGGPLAPASPAAAAAATKYDPCAKCGHVELLIVAPFTERDPETRGSLVQPSVVAWVVDAMVRTAGSFRLHVCMSCGYTEWYAHDLEALARVAGKVWNAKRVQATVANPYR